MKKFPPKQQQQQETLQQEQSNTKATTRSQQSESLFLKQIVNRNKKEMIFGCLVVCSYHVEILMDNEK